MGGNYNSVLEYFVLRHIAEPNQQGESKVPNMNNMPICQLYMHVCMYIIYIYIVHNYINVCGFGPFKGLFNVPSPNKVNISPPKSGRCYWIARLIPNGNPGNQVAPVPLTHIEQLLCATRCIYCKLYK